MLPPSRNMRTLDIYRAYLAQKLLWLIGQRLEFVATGTYQKRTAHSYIKDASDEFELLQMGKFVDLLKEWHCSSKHFFTCVTEAYELARDHGFYEQSDVDTAKAWLTDLSRVGYHIPTMDPDKRICLESHEQESIYFYAEEQSTIMFHTPQKFVPLAATGKHAIQSEIQAICQGKQSSLKFNPENMQVKDKLVIIDVKDAYNSIPLLDAWYRPHASQILYCGNPSEKISSLSTQWMVSIIAPPTGRVSSMSGCIYLASKMGYKVNGYLYVKVDMLFMKGKFNLGASVKFTENTLVPVNEDCKQGCVTLSKEDLEKFSKLLPDLPEFRKTDHDKMITCAAKFAADLTKSGKHTFKDNFAFYLPDKDNIRLPVIRFAESYLRTFSAQVADLLTVAIATCIDPNHTPFIPRQLNQLSQIVDYAQPVAMENIKTDAQLSAYYCQNILI